MFHVKHPFASSTAANAANEGEQALSKEGRREVRRAMGRQSRFVFVYTLIFTLAGYALALALETAGFAGASTFFSDHLGEMSIAGLAAGMLFVLLKLRGRFLPSLRRIDSEPHRMNARMLGTFLLLLVGAQAVFSVITLCLGALADALGYRVFSTMDSLDAAAPTVWMILYAGVLAPIVEEIVFRGVVLGALAKFGQTFAIVASAVLFGLFHGDFSQGGFAFCTGLVLGFAATRYSLGWAIGLHIFNNLVLSDWLGQLVGLLPELGQSIFAELFFLTGILGTVWVLGRNRDGIKRWLAAHRAPAKTALAAFTAPSFLLFAALQTTLSVMAFAPL